MMKRIPDASVDCIITSPPYWQKRDYGFKGQWGNEKNIDEYLNHLQQLMTECYRVLKDEGTVFINLGDTYHNAFKWTRQKKRPQTINKGKNRDYLTERIQNQGLPEKCLSMIPARFAIQCVEAGWVLRNDIIWAKPNSMPESVKDRFANKHEHIFFFTKSRKYYFDLDAIREQYHQASIERNQYKRSASDNKMMAVNREIPPGEHLHPKGKNPGDVSDFWKISTKGNRDNHYAGFNTELVYKPILAGCPKGGVVLDPFCGRGTTGIAVVTLNRKFIGIDGKKDYCEMARTNIEQTLQAKTVKQAKLAGLESPLDGLDFVKKTPITYYGGKQRLVTLILSLIPKHKLYCEPFVGGAAVFFAKEPSEMEVINDLNGEVVNFYQVCKTDFSKLEKLVQSTPHSRQVHRETQEILKNADKFDPVKRAWAFWVQTNMSFSSRIFGGYAYERHSNGTLKRFVNKKLAFTKDLQQRLDMVDIESNDALQVIKSRDGADSFFYCDPPYFNSDMGHYKGYTEKDFTQLLETLSEVEGKFLLSSYPSDVLDGFTKKHKWHTITKQSGVAVTKQTNKIKIEVLTANYPMKSELNGANDQLQMKARCLKLNLNLVDV
uniref:site-specific DNA-methyltransferase (cytosine-N(4)-specific) n=1 Tax=Roseihalotalea indica TaxID=2867963 RepID=A0AA49JFU2_9BACT|nr:DNA methyltransferase [Tunicatimonas sp. TK19036]